MAHVELSLTDAPAGLRLRPVPEPCSSVDHWAAAAAHATEPCLVLDLHTVIVAVSSAGSRLLRIPEAAAVVGRRFVDTVGPLIDFTTAGAPLDEAELQRVPPLLAITSGMMARGLMRLAPPGDRITTVDAVSVPLRDGASVVGSLTFLSGL